MNALFALVVRLGKLVVVWNRSMSKLIAIPDVLFASMELCQSAPPWAEIDGITNLGMPMINCKWFAACNRRILTSATPPSKPPLSSFA